MDILIIKNKIYFLKFKKKAKFMFFNTRNILVLS